MTARTDRGFAHSLPMTLLRAHEAVVLQFRPALRRHGLNEPQWRVLRVLAEHPETTLTALGREAAILAPSLSRMLPLMESRGWIQRRTSPDDQRHGLVTIAPAGRALFDTVWSEVARTYAGMDEAFGARRLAALHEELQALREALPRPPAV
ncbi:MAG: hypothetical protein RL026_320 [Pseudomonadota bacterium]|jgi:homoprotocatechuate degradation regulator HpaR